MQRRSPKREDDSPAGETAPPTPQAGRNSTVVPREPETVGVPHAAAKEAAPREQTSLRDGQLRVDVLLRASDVLALLLYFGATIFVVFFFPILAHRTYFSENALLTNAAQPTYSQADVQLAQYVLQRFKGAEAGALTAPSEGALSRADPVSVLLSAARDAGLDAETHQFGMHLSTEAFVRRFPGRAVKDSASVTVPGTNVVALLRAPRGEGKEAVVLHAEYTDADADEHHLAEGDGSAAVLVSLMQAFARLPWLSKDVLFLASPKSARGHEAVTSWLRDYHAYTTPMLHGGEIWAAVVIKVPADGPFDTVGIGFEGNQGQYPCLDFVNVAAACCRGRGLQPVVPMPHYDYALSRLERNEQRRQARTEAAAGMPADLEPSLRPLKPVRGPELLDFGRTWAVVRGWLQVAEELVMPAYLVQRARNLRRSLVSQALGQPSGNHAAFKAFKIEALSLVAAPDRVLALRDGAGEHLWERAVERYGQVAEQTVHSVSNLLERFHQSFFLWVLIDESSFLPPEKYLAPAGVLLLSLVVRAASLWFAASERLEWRFDELGLVLLAYAAGLAIMLAHDSTGGGLGWQLSSTMIVFAYTYLASFGVLPRQKQKISTTGQVGNAAGRSGDDLTNVVEESASLGLCWHIVRAQCLVLNLLFLATLCLTNYSFGLLVSVGIVPLILLGFAPRPVLYSLVALLGLLALTALTTMALLFEDRVVGGVPGGGRCLNVVHSLILVPAVLLLAVEMGDHKPRIT